MKKRTIALMLSVLAVMMLVGVGFATWVISQGASNEQTGSLVVETVKDNRLNVSVEAVKSGNYEHKDTHEVITAAQYAEKVAALKAKYTQLGSGDYEHEDTHAVISAEEYVNLEDENYQPLDDGTKLNFTAPEVATGEGKWLTAPAGHNIEKRTMVLTVSVTKQDGSEFSEKPVIKYQLSNDSISKAGLVALNDDLSEHTVAANDITLSADSKTATCTITVEYKWGYVFNEQNPFAYFNSYNVSSKLSAADAELAANAGLKYNEADLVGGANAVPTPGKEPGDEGYIADIRNNYGDLAHAALEALFAQQGKTLKATITVEL